MFDRFDYFYSILIDFDGIDQVRQHPLPILSGYCSLYSVVAFGGEIPYSLLGSIPIWFSVVYFNFLSVRSSFCSFKGLAFDQVGVVINIVFFLD